MRTTNAKDNYIIDPSFQTIFQQSPISTQIFSPEGMTIMVNKAWEKLWQTKQKDIIYRYNILKDKQLVEKKIMPLINKAFKGEIVSIPAIKYEPHKTIPGISRVEHKWVKAIMYPIRNQQGQIIQLVLQHEDITDIKQAEEKLQESEKRFRLYIEHSFGGIVLTTPDGKSPYVSASMKQVLGYTPDEYRKLNGADLVYPDDLKNETKFFQNILKKPGKTFPPHQTRFKHKDGSYRWIEYIATNLIKDPNIGAIIFNFRDITERKQVEEQQQFLEQASNILGASIDYKKTLKNLSKLIIPYLADYCRIVVVDENKHIQEISVNHANPSKIPLVKELYNAYKDGKTQTSGVGRVIETGKAERITIVTSEIYKNANVKVARLMKELHLQSYMGIPMKISNKIVGALTFSSTKKERLYTKYEQPLAEELARRAALAIENAKLYRSVQEELREKTQAQEEQSRLVTLLDQTYDAILLWKLNGKITYWNKGAEELYRYSKDEAIGKIIHRFLKTKHPILYSKIETTLLKTGRWQGEIKHTTKDNKEIIVSCRKVLITQSDGTKYILETNRDITERVWFEKNLKYLSEASKMLASSLDYKTTLQNVTKLAVPEIADWAGVSMKTDNGIEQLAVAHIDPKKVKWAKELNRKNPPDPNAKTGIPNILRTGQSEFYPNITDEMLVAAAKDEEQLALLRKLRFTSAMTVPMRIGKEIIGVISFVSAESGRHYTKADLAIAEELATRAGIAIDNAMLYTNAQKAIALRDDFISLASHELKTPITSLKMYAQSLGRQFAERGDISLQSYFEKMDQQTDKLSLLVNDLLNVSKIQHGKLEFTMESVDLNIIAKDIVDAVQETTKKHKIIIEGEIKKKVYADQYRIYQVLTNLLTNAIKYSPSADKIIVQLTTEKDFAMVAVQDFGIGIEPEEQKKIFSQFYRVTNPEEKTFPGLGMGLYISKEIIKRHGGAIHVVSSKGKGSQFSFTLPYNALQNRTEQNRK